MNYEYYAIDKMQKYHSKLVGVRNLEEELAELRERQTSLKTCSFDALAVPGSRISRAEDAMINLIANIDEKERILKQNKRELRRVKRALSALTEKEREVATAFLLIKWKIQWITSVGKNIMNEHGFITPGVMLSGNLLGLFMVP